MVVRVKPRYYDSKCKECGWLGRDCDLVNRWNDLKNFIYCPDCKGDQIVDPEGPDEKEQGLGQK